MIKFIKILVSLFLLTSILYVADVWKDKKTLQENLIRLHVVADSNSQEDQAIKLQVKDAVVSYLQPLVEGVGDKKQDKPLPLAGVCLCFLFIEDFNHINKLHNKASVFQYAAVYSLSVLYFHMLSGREWQGGEVVNRDGE